ncbi:MAG: TraB/GumN family protein [Pseudomonadota bacterium]
MKRDLAIGMCTALFISAAHAEVPRWVVSDADSTMTLFPTIHILPDDLDWESEAMLTALNNAEEVWFELLPSEVNDQALMQQLAIKHGLSPQLPLSKRLDKETYGKFSQVATELGLAPAQLGPMRPWLAGVTLAVTDLIRDGFSPDAGVEMVLAKKVDSDRHRGLETADQQLGFFASLSPEVEKAFLIQTIDEIGKNAEELRGLATAWADGDVSRIEALILTSIRDVSTELYETLIVARNEAWAERLTLELQGSGTDFVAVGGGHLVGADGLPGLLAARGYKVEGPGF